jgi:hypothetical protein
MDMQVFEQKRFDLLLAFHEHSNPPDSSCSQTHHTSLAVEAGRLEANQFD